MISPKHLDMLSLSWDPRPNLFAFPSHTFQIYSEVTLQWIQLVKKNKAQTPDICYSCPWWRKDGAGSKGKQHQILNASRSKPFPSNARHHAPPRIYSVVGIAIIHHLATSLSFRPSPWAATMTSSGLLDASFLILTSKVLAIQKSCSSKEKFSHNTWPSVTNSSISCVMMICEANRRIP